MRKAFNRFILTYLLFSLLLIAALIPVYSEFYGASQSREIARNQSILENGAAAIDNAINTVLETASLTSEYSLFQILKYDTIDEKKVYTSIPEMVRMFNGLIISQELISDAVILISDTIVLTRYRGFYSDSFYSFYPEFFSLKNASWREWYGALSGAQSGYLPCAEYESEDFGSYEAVAFVCKWSVSALSGNSMLLFVTLPSQKLLPLIATDETLSTGYVAIRDKYGKLLLSSGQPLTADYARMSLTTNESNMNITVDIPNAILSMQLSSTRKAMYMYAALQASLMVMLAVIFAFRTSAPIRRLTRLIDDGAIDGRAANFHVAEYQTIATHVISQDQQLTEYQRVIQAQKQQLRSRLFENALIHGFHEKQSVDDFLLAFPQFPSSYRLMNIIAADSGAALEETSLKRHRLLEITSRILPGQLYRQYLNTTTLALLLPAETDCAGAMETLSEQAKKEISSILYCGVSDAFNTLQDLARAYQQAQFFCFVAKRSKSTQLPQYATRSLQKTFLSFTLYDIQVLYDALTVGSEETALSILGGITARVKEQNAGHIETQHMYDMLADTAKHVKLENPQLLSGVALPTFSNKNIDEIREEFAACFIGMCRSVKQWLSGAEQQLARDICDYINQNFADAGLYVHTLAKHFGLSEPTLQKLLRAATGKTCAAYLTMVRLEHAYHLLSTTGYSVNDVASRCGFISANTFYRAFKNKYSVVPSAIQKHELKGPQT